MIVSRNANLRQKIGKPKGDEMISRDTVHVFANAKHISKDSYKLAFDIMEKSHVEARSFPK